MKAICFILLLGMAGLAGCGTPAKQVKKVYDVRDLLVFPDPTTKAPVFTSREPPADRSIGEDPTINTREEEARKLMARVRCAAGGWGWRERVEGRDIKELNGMLIVQGTDRVHQRVQRELAQLRAAMPAEKSE